MKMSKKCEVICLNCKKGIGISPEKSCMDILKHGWVYVQKTSVALDKNKNNMIQGYFLCEKCFVLEFKKC
jgi:hypothetical protein